MHTHLRILLSTAALLSAVISPASALKPERGYTIVPAHLGIVCDEVKLKTTSGVTLQAWFFPAQDTVGIANHLVGRVMTVPDSLRPKPRAFPEPSSDKHQTIVICGGDAGNMSYLILYAYQFFTHGFNVLTFDWRGFGMSDPWPIEQDMLVYPVFLEDYAAAIDCAKCRPETQGTRVGLLGFSTGAYLSFAMAAQRDDIGAFVGRALITSFDDILEILRKQEPERGFRPPKDYPRELLPVEAASKIRIPVLLVVGENDERTPPWMSRRVFDLLPGTKDLWIVPGAGHGGSEAPEMVAFPEFFSRAREFFQQHLALRVLDRPSSGP